MSLNIHDYIEDAQKLLLPEGCIFDEERRRFISNLESGDLVAVPGSGKTTALQAKLFCLSKFLPFKDGSGVLVLSHTNAAVEEVKKRLAFNAPHLFSYPSAVLTVQEFIDRFLALPFYSFSYNTSISVIDGARYHEAVNYYLKQRKYHFVNAIYKNTELGANPFHSARLYYDRELKKARIAGDLTGSELSIPLPKTWARTAEEKEAEIREMIIEMKKDLMEQGILHFEDCYFLANAYISNYPNVVDYLRRRFPFVFVDETQDLKKYQLDIIDELFNTQDVVLQRVGDHNQAIFSNGKEGDCEWNPRNIGTLENSLRLSGPVAMVVNPFMLKREGVDSMASFKVNGMQPNPMSIPPILLLYSDGDGTKLRDIFKKLIHDTGLDCHVDSKYGFCIIGWNASYQEEETGEKKLRLENVFPEYKHRSATRLSKRQSLSDYISCIDETSSPKTIKEELLMAVCRALSLSKAWNIIKRGGRDVQRHYTPATFSSKAKETHELSDEFDSVFYGSVNSVRKGNKADAYRLLRDYLINRAVMIVSGTINEELNAFVGTSYIESEIETSSSAIVDDEFPIVISTVHSVKGQTHCATMYVETAFRSKYESEWLIETKKPTKRSPSTLKTSPFFGEEYITHTDSAKKAMKMLYVGFSRPKHLLCYASVKSLWNNEMLMKMKNMGWKIYDTTIDNWILSE